MIQTGNQGVTNADASWSQEDNVSKRDYQSLIRSVTGRGYDWGNMGTTFTIYERQLLG